MEAQSSGISWIIEPELSKGGLLLSGFILSQDAAFLNKNGIHAVLSLIPRDSNKKILYEPPIEGRVFFWDSADSTDITGILDDTFDWLQYKLRATNVLVHCIEGVSASPIVAVHYLMRKRGWYYEEALIHVKERRDNIRPSLKLVAQLKQHIEKSNPQEPDSQTS